MKPIDKELFKSVIINLLLSFFIVVAMWYTGGFIKGMLSKIGVILFTPGFLFLVLLKIIFRGEGAMEAMDDYSYKTLLIVSFIFYSSIIALIQMFVYKWKKKKKLGYKEDM